MNNNILKYGEMKLLFGEFILKGYIYMVLMEEICVLNIEIVYVIKKWIVDDLLYLEWLL